MYYENRGRCYLGENHLVTVLLFLIDEKAKDSSKKKKETFQENDFLPHSCPSWNYPFSSFEIIRRSCESPSFEVQSD